MSENTVKKLSEAYDKIILTICGVLLFAQFQSMSEMKNNQVAIREGMSVLKTEVSNLKYRLEKLEGWKEDFPKFNP